tara:strand:+ start:265 stop:624 length:360 start_codon:yes stop_codon:yes gene_type:complete
MSFVSQGKPSRMRSVYGHNTTDAVGVVYTCPPNCIAHVTFIHVVNSGSSTNTVDVEWYVAADSYIHNFLSAVSFDPPDFFSFNNIDLVLQSGDKIQVHPTGAGHIDSIVTVTETFIPVG